MKAIENSTVSIITSNSDEGRSFDYTLNKKKAKAKLLKGAKRATNLDVEVKSGCVNLRFSYGSYYEVVLPLLKSWTDTLDEVQVIGST